MWLLMSKDGPELKVGDHSHIRCEVLAIRQQEQTVVVRLEGGLGMECTPAAIGCYMLLQEHPTDD